jgi:hypothetical protein
MPPEITGDEYFSRYLKEGAKAPEDAKLDPALQKTLAKLYERQCGEAQDLIIKQKHDAWKIWGTNDHPYMVKENREEAAHQTKRFVTERERYIREYHDAKKLGEELKQQEKERALSPDNAPKKSR